MRRRKLVAALALGCAIAEGEGPLFGDWQQTSFLRESRCHHTATLLPSGKVLIAGGTALFYTPSPQEISSAEIYDPTMGTWKFTGSLLTPRSWHTATLLASGKVLVVGGLSNGSDLASAEIYDPSTETWSFTGSLSRPRYSHTATLLPSGKVLVVGGGDTTGALAGSEIYDPATGTWSLTGSISTLRHSHTTTLLPSGKVLLIGWLETAAEIYDPQTETWSLTGSLAMGRLNPTATLLPSGKVLVAGGSTGGDATASTEIYDPESGIWASAAPLAEAREDHSATLLPTGKVLVVGGVNDTINLSSAELYDPATNTWEAAGSLSLPSWAHTATLLPSGGVLMAGGFTGFDGLSLVEIYYPPGGSCQATAFLPTSRLKPEVVPLRSGKILVTGGNQPGAELYDELVGGWEVTGSPMITRHRAVTVLLSSGKVLMAGGSSGPNAVDTVELYDPTTGFWEPTGSLRTARFQAAGAVLPSGKVLVAGGLYDFDGPSLSSVELYSPETHTWEEVQPLATPRYSHTATLLPSGKVLIAGGHDGRSVLASVELYDPTTDIWELTGELVWPRSNHTATLLDSGKVLVVGGDAPASTSAEIYDPATGTWTATSPPPSPRFAHTATLLPSGRVFVAGETTADIYNPATGTWGESRTLFTSRRGHSAAFLPTTKSILLVGGTDSNYVSLLNAEECWFAATDLARWPFIGFWTPIEYGVPLTITGSFRGDSEASGGTRQSTAVNFPLLLLRTVDGTRQSWLTPDPRPNFWDDPMTLTVSDLPPTLHPGPHLLSAVVAGVPSDFVPVEVRCSLAITRHPMSQTASLGSTISFSVESQGGRRYQWRKDGVDIPGATSATYTTPSISPDDSGAAYTVLVETGCMSQVSNPAVLTVADSVPPNVSVVSPSGGEYWTLSSPDAPSNEIVTWSMSDNIRICRIEARLLFSGDGGQAYQPVPDPAGGVLLTTGPGGICRFGEQPSVTSLSYDVPESPPSGMPGSLYKIEVRVTDHAGLTASARSTNPFFIVQPNPDTVRTLILSNVQRMRTIQGFSQEQADTLVTKLRELAGHPRVQGLVIDLASVTSLESLYQNWDAEPANPNRANALLFVSGGLHNYLRSELLPTYTGVRNLILVGDDRIIPFARVPDQTGLRESAYIAGGDLTAVGTVGAALAADHYLSDDLLATRGLVDIPLTADQRERGTFLPDFAVGRLVENPEEIVAAIATFISQDGVLDLLYFVRFPGSDFCRL